MSSHAGLPGPPRGLLWLAALVYTVFVVYGSLVPLQFRALPWDDAMVHFGAIPFLQLGIGSRADWVANLLLFIPRTFLWMGALTAGAGALRTLMATLALIPVPTVRSVGIEFTQLFFPQRAAPQNDISAETLGRLVARWLGGGRGGRWRSPMSALAMLMRAGLSILVEGGQLMLPHRVVDRTDWLLAWHAMLLRDMRCIHHRVSLHVLPPSGHDHASQNGCAPSHALVPASDAGRHESAVVGWCTGILCALQRSRVVSA